MSASVVYTNVLGQVLMESRGGVDTEFIPDPLGNVVKCKTSSVGFSYSAEYWPYGEIQTSSGSNPSNFGYVGTWGYYQDSPNQTYVRARYYKPVQSRWSTVDPLWPREKAYGYAKSIPIANVDPLGLKPGKRPTGSVTCTEEWRSWISDYCYSCRKNGFNPDCMKICNRYVSSYGKACGWKGRTGRPNEQSSANKTNCGRAPSCEQAARRAGERKDKNGNINIWWIGLCTNCCNELFGDLPPVVTGPTPDILEYCWNSCFEGDLLPPVIIGPVPIPAPIR